MLLIKAKHISCNIRSCNCMHCQFFISIDHSGVALFSASAGASPGTKNTAIFFTNVVTPTQPNKAIVTVIFRLPVTRDNIRIICLTQRTSVEKKVDNAANCPNRSILFRCRNPQNVLSRF